MGRLARGVPETGELAAEHVAIEEDEATEGLVLGAGADVARAREVREVGRDLGRAERFRVALAVEADVTPDPAEVRLLGPEAVVPSADRGADALEKLSLARQGHLRCGRPGRAAV